MKGDASIPEPAEHSEPAESGDDTDGFVRIPGVYRRFEIEQLLRAGCDFHIVPERLAPGTQLFTVYRHDADDDASWSEPERGILHAPERENGATPRPSPVNSPDQPASTDRPTAARARPTPSRSAARDRPSQLHEPSLGELKARHREEHLCLRCSHHMVCGMSKALDANLLVTVAACLGFEPVAAGAPDDTRDWAPVQPPATP